MITEADILGITEVIRGKLATAPLVEEATTYNWGGYKGVRLCHPLKAECKDGLLTLSLGTPADLDGYYVESREPYVTLSGDLSGFPKLIYSPGFSGCHLALFSRKQGGSTLYLGAHIYKGAKDDIPKAVADHPDPNLTLARRWSSAGKCGGGKQVSGLIWVTGDDATGYWVTIIGPGTKGGAKATVEVADAL